jgi:hypothetical protein
MKMFAVVKTTMKAKKKEPRAAPKRRAVKSKNMSVSALLYRSTQSTMSSRKLVSYLVGRSRSAPWRLSSLFSSVTLRRSTSLTRSTQTSMHSTVLPLPTCCRS